MNLENQIKKVDGIVSGFEKQLSNDGAISDTPNALHNRTQNLQVSRIKSYMLKKMILQGFFSKENGSTKNTQRTLCIIKGFSASWKCSSDW